MIQQAEGTDLLQILIDSNYDKKAAAKKYSKLARITPQQSIILVDMAIKDIDAVASTYRGGPLDSIGSIRGIKCMHCNSSYLTSDEACPECGRLNERNVELGEPSLLRPIVVKKEETVICPKCGSAQLSNKTKGFSLGKAVIGSALTMSPVGLLGGVIGSKKTIIVCLKCGHEWQAGKLK